MMINEAARDKTVMAMREQISKLKTELATTKRRLNHSEFHRMKIREHLKRQRQCIKEQLVGLEAAKQRVEIAEAALEDREEG